MCQKKLDKKQRVCRLERNGCFPSHASEVAGNMVDERDLLETIDKAVITELDNQKLPLKKRIALLKSELSANEIQSVIQIQTGTTKDGMAFFQTKIVKGEVVRPRKLKGESDSEYAERTKGIKVTTLGKLKSPALEVRQRARQDSHKLAGDAAPERHELEGTIRTRTVKEIKKPEDSGT